MVFYPFILVGSVIGIIMISFLEIAPWIALTVFAILSGPLVLDGWTQYIGLRTSNNVLRSITGALAGAGMGFGITYMIIRFFF
jgi:uncharacterized membrane protein